MSIVTVLRDHVAVLNALANELEAVAEVLESQELVSTQVPVVPVADYGIDPVSEVRPVMRYPYSKSSNPEAVGKMAEEDLRRGCDVLLQRADGSWLRYEGA